MMTKPEHAKALISAADTPALMCSFGKDSMVLLHLVRETIGLVPLIYHRHPWFTFKNEFADHVINSWALEVYDYPPMACGVKVNADRLELVSRYPFGLSGMMDIPLNTEQPVPRRPFVCGLEFIRRPKTVVAQFPWKSVLIGHKSSDVDPYEGAVPLKSDTAVVGHTKIAFPLRDWTDTDVWEYIEKHKVPYDKRRYHGRGELADKWCNPDYIHACTNCVDPRETQDTVWCPKFKRQVRNLGDEVLRLEVKPSYIGMEEAA
jgi:3'-phosphoadenosine 5'-phosphosulfate sulfotransferase (PAPS reductase)/FAD synthetase